MNSEEENDYDEEFASDIESDNEELVKKNSKEELVDSDGEDEKSNTNFISI